MLTAIISQDGPKEEKSGCVLSVPGNRVGQMIGTQGCGHKRVCRKATYLLLAAQP